MNPFRTRMLLCALSLVLAACAKKDGDADMSASGGAPATPPPAIAPAPAAPAQPEGRIEAAKDAVATASGEVVIRRHIAIRHDMQLFTDPAGVESAWRTANEACEAAGCDIVSSAMVRNDEQQPAQATLEARVAPEKFGAFLAQVTALGTVGQHSKTAEDKTDEVIDVDARIKNMSDFRDNLRRLMATPGAKLKDLIEVEREIVRVQSEVDSLSSRRKALAGQTEKVRIVLTIAARPAVLAQGMWAPVRQAYLGAGQVFANAVAGVVSFAVIVLPWALILGAAWWVVRRVRRP